MQSPAIKRSRFLAAEWRHLILANYSIDPSVLKKYLPSKTEIDFYDGHCYVSLVGFMFEHVKVLGVTIPFHENFPEVNLRFYVRFKENNSWKRGVVFISEIVPKSAVSFVANNFFKERYRTMRMRHVNQVTEKNRIVAYQWQYKNNWQTISCETVGPGSAFMENSHEEFFTQHFWGFTALANKRTAAYEVTHPPWDVYAVRKYGVDCDFDGLYGPDFAQLSKETPASVILAAGSAIAVYNKRVL